MILDLKYTKILSEIKRVFVIPQFKEVDGDITIYKKTVNKNDAQVTLTDRQHQYKKDFFEKEYQKRQSEILSKKSDSIENKKDSLMKEKYKNANY